MRNAAREFQAVAVITAAVVLLARDAQAYLDPGTGSFIFQTIVAMLLGAAFTVRHYWQRVKGVFSGRPRARTASPTDEGDRS